MRLLWHIGKSSPNVYPVTGLCGKRLKRKPLFSWWSPPWGCRKCAEKAVEILNNRDRTIRISLMKDGD